MASQAAIPARRQRIRELVAHGVVSAHSIAAQLDIPYHTIRKDMAAMDFSKEFPHAWAAQVRARKGRAAGQQLSLK